MSKILESLYTKRSFNNKHFFHTHGLPCNVLGNNLPTLLHLLDILVCLHNLLDLMHVGKHHYLMGPLNLPGFHNLPDLLPNLTCVHGRNHFPSPPNLPGSTCVPKNRPFPNPCLLPSPNCLPGNQCMFNIVNVLGLLPSHVCLLGHHYLPMHVCLPRNHHILGHVISPRIDSVSTCKVDISTCTIPHP